MIIIITFVKVVSEKVTQFLKYIKVVSWINLFCKIIPACG